MGSHRAITIESKTITIRSGFIGFTIKNNNRPPAKRWTASYISYAIGFPHNGQWYFFFQRSEATDLPQEGHLSFDNLIIKAVISNANVKQTDMTGNTILAKT